MMTLNLAVRNLLRNRRRSLATLLAMAIGSTAIIIVWRLQWQYQLRPCTPHTCRTGAATCRSSIVTFSFTAVVTRPRMPLPITKQIRDRNSRADAGPAQTWCWLTTPTLQFGGIAGNYSASVSRTVIGNGFVAKDINQMRSWNDFGLRSKSPVFALEGAADDAVVVGTGVARVLQLCDALKIENCPKPQKQPKARRRFRMTLLN
jgi:putative ABC transport system permease protein